MLSFIPQYNKEKKQILQILPGVVRERYFILLKMSLIDIQKRLKLPVSWCWSITLKKDCATKWVYCLSSTYNLTISMPKATHNFIPRPCRLYLDRLYNFALLMQFTPFLQWGEREEDLLPDCVLRWAEGFGVRVSNKYITLLSLARLWQCLQWNVKKNQNF